MRELVKLAHFVALMSPGCLEARLEQECDVELGGGVRLAAPPLWVRDTPSRWHLALEEKGIVELAPTALAVDLKETGEPWRGTGLGPRYEPPIERIWHANLALWLARPCPATIMLYLHLEEMVKGEVYFDAQLTRRSRLRPHVSYQDARLTPSDLDRAAALNAALACVDDDTSIMNAARALFTGLCESSGALRYLLLWIALEALFAPSDPTEATHRLRQRLALFL